jgi:uncharacterized membrane protein
MGDGIMVEEHKIGIPELYSEVRTIGDKLTEYINRQDVQFTSQGHRLSELEKDVNELKAQYQADHAEKKALARQLWMSTLTALFFPVILLVLGLVIAK